MAQAAAQAASAPPPSMYTTMLTGSAEKAVIEHMASRARLDTGGTFTAPGETVRPVCPEKRSATEDAPGRRNGGHCWSEWAARKTREAAASVPGVQTVRTGGCSDGGQCVIAPPGSIIGHQRRRGRQKLRRVRPVARISIIVFTKGARNIIIVAGV